MLNLQSGLSVLIQEQSSQMVRNLLPKTQKTWEAMANPDSRNGRIVGYIGNVQGFADAREKN